MKVQVYLHVHPDIPSVGIGGHRRRPLCRRYLTSDIGISYSDIGKKYVGLNPFIPISEEKYQV
jgi:hypothetical protein